MSTLQSLIALLRADENTPASPELEKWVGDWKRHADPDWTQPHFHVRYVACGFDQNPAPSEGRQVAALAMHQGRVSPDQALLLNLSLETAVPSAKAWLRFATHSILVTYRADSGLRTVVEWCRTVSGESLELPMLDLAELLPELFPEAQEQCRHFIDWLRYFDLPETHDNAMEDAMLIARLWQAVLLRAAERGMATPSDLRRLEKARRWLWAP